MPSLTYYFTVNLNPGKEELIHEQNTFDIEKINYIEFLKTTKQKIIDSIDAEIAKKEKNLDLALMFAQDLIDVGIEKDDPERYKILQNIIKFSSENSQQP